MYGHGNKRIYLIFRYVAFKMWSLFITLSSILCILIPTAQSQGMHFLLSFRASRLTANSITISSRGSFRSFRIFRLLQHTYIPMLDKEFYFRISSNRKISFNFINIYIYKYVYRCASMLSVLCNHYLIYNCSLAQQLILLQTYDCRNKIFIKY